MRKLLVFCLLAVLLCGCQASGMLYDLPEVIVTEVPEPTITGEDLIGKTFDEVSDQIRIEDDMVAYGYAFGTDMLGNPVVLEWEWASMRLWNCLVYPTAFRLQDCFISSFLTAREIPIGWIGRVSPLLTGLWWNRDKERIEYGCPGCDSRGHILFLGKREMGLEFSSCIC